MHIAADARGARLVLGADDAVALDRLKQVRVLSIGKAAAPMLQALQSRLPLPPSCHLEGVLIAPGERPPNLPATIQFFAGGHPYPNPASFAGASAALSIDRKSTRLNSS